MTGGKRVYVDGTHEKGRETQKKREGEADGSKRVSKRQSVRQDTSERAERGAQKVVEGGARAREQVGEI